MARRQTKVVGGPVEGPWLLPEGWRWERLSQVAALHDHLRRPVNNTERLTRNAGKSQSELYPYYGATGRVGYIDDFLVEGDYLLLGEDGAPFLDPTKQKAYPVSGRFWVNNHAHILSTKKNLESRLLLHWLNTIQYKSYVNGTTRLKLTQEAMLEMPVPVPRAEIQKKLADKVDDLLTDLDDGEALLVRARDDLGTWRKALLKAAVTGELTSDWRTANPPAETGADLLARILNERRTRWLAEPRNKGKRYVDPATPDTTSLPPIPDSWTWASIEQFTTGGIRNGISIKESVEPTDVRGLRLDALRSDGIDWSRYRYLPITLERASNYLLSAGDLLISRANGSPEYLGRCSLVSTGRDDTVFPDTSIRYPLWGNQQFHDWVRAAWSAPTIRQKMLKSAKTTAGILKISQSDIAAVALPLPPWSEIVKIDALMSLMSEEADLGSETVDTLSVVPATLRQSILSAAFRGDLVA